MKLSQKTKRAILNYGRDFCLYCAKRVDSGDGSRTVAFEYGWTTRQGDAAANAGFEIIEKGLDKENFSMLEHEKRFRESEYIYRYDTWYKKEKVS